MNINPPHPNTPTRHTKLFFPLAFVFCQPCFAFSDGGLSFEQYHRNKLMDDILNQELVVFKTVAENRRFSLRTPPGRVVSVKAMLRQVRSNQTHSRERREARHFVGDPSASYHSKPESSVQNARKPVLPRSTGTAVAW